MLVLNGHCGSVDNSDDGHCTSLIIGCDVPLEERGEEDSGETFEEKLWRRD